MVSIAATNDQPEQARSEQAVRGSDFSKETRSLELNPSHTNGLMSVNVAVTP